MLVDRRRNESRNEKNAHYFLIIISFASHRREMEKHFLFVFFFFFFKHSSQCFATLERSEGRGKERKNPEIEFEAPRVRLRKCKSPARRGTLINRLGSFPSDNWHIQTTRESSNANYIEATLQSSRQDDLHYHATARRSWRRERGSGWKSGLGDGGGGGGGEAGTAFPRVYAYTPSRIREPLPKRPASGQRALRLRKCCRR